MSYQVILPSIHQPYTTECFASMSDNFRKNTYVHDNTQNNIGVTPAWNIGLQEMYNRGADWLVLLSAAIRFGERGGDDIAEYLEAHPDLDVVEALEVYGWHLIAFNKRLFDRVGTFDENMPIYFSDIDWSLRIQKAYAPSNAPWEKIEFDVTDKGMAHGIKLAGVQEAAERPILYFVTKWGRHPGAYQLGSYDHPFNEEDKDIKYWPKANFIGGQL